MRHFFNTVSCKPVSLPLPTPISTTTNTTNTTNTTSSSISSNGSNGGISSNGSNGGDGSNDSNDSNDSTNPQCPEFIQRIAIAMSNRHYGLIRKNRKYGSTKFLNCFIGSQAIDWLCRGVKGLGSVDQSLEGERGEFAGSNRKRARSIMNVMLRQEYIRHACNNSGMFQGE